MAKSSALKQNCNDQSSLGSYSDLFEEFFKTDAQPIPQLDESSAFLYPEQQQQQQVAQHVQAPFYPPVDPYQQQMLAYYYAQQQQQPQVMHQPMQMQPMQQLLPQQAMIHGQHLQHVQPYPMMAAICKPGFARRPPRKQSKSKNYTAQAAQANHMASLQTASEFAQEAPQPQPIQAHPQPISPKSNASSQPTSPTSTRSAGTSDFVKHRLQQKIRARMIQKGQIPPNPTQDELRRCGVPLSPVPSVPASLANSPKADLAAFVASTVTAPKPQPQPQQQLQQANLGLFFNDAWMSQPFQPKPQQHSERDPLVHFTANQQKLAPEPVNYDDFFSDFIQY